MSHQRLKLSWFLTLVMILAVSLSAGAVEMGKAEGTVTYKGKSCSLKHALAVDRANEFNPSQREVVLFLSDAPISLEQVKNDDVEHEVAHLEIKFDESGKAVYSSVRWEYSGAGTSDGIHFEGTLDRAKKTMSGKVLTKGKVEIYGNALEISVDFKAPIQKL